MKDKKEEIKKSSYFSLCLSHCIFFCDILLILQLIIQITQLGVITLYLWSSVYLFMWLFMSVYLSFSMCLSLPWALVQSFFLIFLKLPSFILFSHGLCPSPSEYLPVFVNIFISLFLSRSLSISFSFIYYKREDVWSYNTDSYFNSSVFWQREC